MDDAIRVRQVIENRTAVTTALPDDSVATAALRMTEQRIGSLLIADADGKLVGIVSERDLMTKVVARKRNPETTLIKDVMSPDIIS
ncbi:MAG: cyclic nucleotide-binding/CBS domain-containing protein, partial [Planctomycetota bacterium]